MGARRPRGNGSGGNGLAAHALAGRQGTFCGSRMRMKQPMRLAFVGAHPAPQRLDVAADDPETRRRNGRHARRRRRRCRATRNSGRRSAAARRPSTPGPSSAITSSAYSARAMRLTLIVPASPEKDTAFSSTFSMTVSTMSALARTTTLLSTIRRSVDAALPEELGMGGEHALDQGRGDRHRRAASPADRPPPRRAGARR